MDCEGGKDVTEKQLTKKVKVEQDVDQTLKPVKFLFGRPPRTFSFVDACTPQLDGKWFVKKANKEELKPLEIIEVTDDAGQSSNSDVKVPIEVDGKDGAEPKEPKVDAV